MEPKKMAEILSGNTYPGRGIVIGKTQDGRHAAIAYFIMGRSENSRNRIFVEDGLGIQTKAFDESKLTDPSLIIYAPVRVLNNITVVTNGDQTDTVYQVLAQGGSFEDALRTRTFEPDAPNFTPRISGQVIIENGFQYKLSILKSNYGNQDSVLRYFYEYAEPVNGEGHFIHTYRGDGNPIPSFEGEPIRVSIENHIDSFTNTIWENLNHDNKVSLFTRFIQLENGSMETRMINKNQ